MKDEILSQLNYPARLEKLYRANKAPFRREFNQLYPTLKGNLAADFWYERLNHETGELHRGTNNELLFIITASLIAGLIAKLPAFLPVGEEFYYPRNIGFVVFPVLSAYFAWKNKLSTGKIGFMAGTMLVSLLYINMLPDVKNSDTLILSCIHLSLFLWALLGFAFAGASENKIDKRLGYLKYNGDLIVMTTLILIAGGIMTGITIGLFELIGIHIQDFYFRNIVIPCLAAAPIIGTFLTRTNPHLVGKVSPVIARLFSPLILVMLVIYLSAIVYARKDPYQDREFLLMFNALLVGVMAIIFFSVAETSGAAKSRAEIWILFLLSVLTIAVNSIALSAILFRISEWGLTPNRAAVLGGNVLILINLLLVAAQFFKVLFRKADLAGVGRSIALYLPVYVIWTVIVTFLFPLLFGFK